MAQDRVEAYANWLVEHEAEADTEDYKEVAQAYKGLRESAPVDAAPDKDYFGSGIIEPVRAIASAANQSILGGYSGAIAEAVPGGRKGADVVKDFQADAFKPRTESGQKNLEKVGELAQFGIDVANMPITSLYGLAEWVGSMASGNSFTDVDSQLDTINRVEGQGFGKTVGEDVFQATGSPVMSTLAQIAPEAMAELLALKGGGNAVTVARQAAPGAATAAANTAGTVVNAAKELIPLATNTARRVSEYQTPGTQRRVAEIGEQIDTGGVPASRDVTAGYRNEPIVPEVGGLPAVIEDGATGAPDYTTNGKNYKTVKDPQQKAALHQGWDAGLVAMIREASPIDRDMMRGSLQIMKESKANKRYRMTARTSDVGGQAVMGRYNTVRKKNKEAGKGIDEYARSNMQDTYVDFKEPVDTFMNDLERMGVTQNTDNTLDFSKSSVQGLTGIENFLGRVANRMSSPRDITAYEMHLFKRFIDQQVTYGKPMEGLAGDAEGVIKTLRHNIDGVLDARFPEYDNLNITYGESIRAIDAFKQAIGRGIDVDGRGAHSAVGTGLRAVGSDRQSRVALMNSLEDLDSLAKKYGGEFKNDVLTQAQWVLEMDKMFGTNSDAGFSARISQGIANAPTSAAGAVTSGAKFAAQSLLGINQESRFAAMEELLKSFDN